ncbi:MAG: hypothetical protein ONB48_02940 [candidate division KSB1 bacterium]|nr:hypothetical protein [candidate division KSB1 bacterium]MDZ7275707.1 hypothetical protein [candidate division KSB1 bacterium]MDZ7284602.1 hypothetical protein [candidate division KSB1 bacterium]MDZ7297979.1 hypothetical protein [candidate division KSB1 bacterium]MDZ7305853.1 hypothetical protein [candidate division KSB1 bacterium]
MDNSSVGLFEHDYSLTRPAVASKACRLYCNLPHPAAASFLAATAFVATGLSPRDGKMVIVAHKDAPGHKTFKTNCEPPGSQIFDWHYCENGLSLLRITPLSAEIQSSVWPKKYLIGACHADQA